MEEIKRQTPKEIIDHNYYFAKQATTFELPTLVMHGEDDQVVPVKDSAKKSARLIKGAQEIYYR
jgi:alpha-beta hydrolase superfamily lysophospholipase